MNLHKYSFQCVGFCPLDNFSIVPIKCRTFLFSDADLFNNCKCFLSRNQNVLESHFYKQSSLLSLILCSLQFSGDRQKYVILNKTSHKGVLSKFVIEALFPYETCWPALSLCISLSYGLSIHKRMDC